MRPRRRLFFLLVLLLALQACAPDVAATAVPTPTDFAPGPSDLLTPAAVQPANAFQAVPAEPPKMEVGGLYRYFDGALLDAVPNQGPVVMGDNIQPDAPQHQVTVSDFWMYSVEVTNAMYAWCVSVGKCSSPNLQDDPRYNDPFASSNPVVGVDWQQAADYCGFVHGSLPTEAQWEKAASWDATAKAKRLYPWGSRKPSCAWLNFAGCGGSASPVTSYAQGESYYGVYNMAGNVFEWTADWYSPTYYTSSPVQDPAGPATGTRRVIRSSSYQADAFFSETARRFSAPPPQHRPDLGFRCVVNDPTYFAPFCTAPVFYGAAVPAPGSAPVSTKPCPDPVVQSYSGCASGKAPVNFVTIQNTAPTIVTVTGLQGCTPADNALGVTHQCKLGVSIQVQSSCDVQPAGTAACPPNFKQDPNNPKQCVANGAPGACPAGYQFDPQLQCCSVAAGTNAPAPLCSVGEHLYEGTCVDDATGPRPPASLTYVTSSGFDCAPNNPGHQCPAGEKYTCSDNSCSCH